MLTITSSAFSHKQPIPEQYTCKGKDINPPLSISGAPEQTQTLVLIMDDPDAPNGTWDHWIVYNIKPTEQITENSIPGTQARNSFNKVDYGGPCPPSGTHRYFFKLYALDTSLELDSGADKRHVEQAMQGHILEQAELIGLFSK